MKDKTMNPNAKDGADAQTSIHQNNSGSVVVNGDDNTLNPIINNNTTNYTFHDNSVTNTVVTMAPQIDPVKKLVNYIVEVIIKTVVSTVITALMSKDLGDLNIPEFTGLQVNIMLLVLWLGIYGITSLLILL